MLVPPKLSGELNSRDCLRRVPGYVTCKGMFFDDVISACRRLKDRLPESLQELISRRYVPFMDYPLVDHMRLTSALAPVKFPNVACKQGLRELGWLAYPNFAESHVGKLTKGLLRLDVEHVLDVAPRSISLSLSHGSVESTRLEPRTYKLQFREIYGFLDCYYVGVVEGAIKYYGMEPKVDMELSTPIDGTFMVTW